MVTVFYPRKLMASPAPIPDDRPLTAEEAAVVRWMLEHGLASAARYLPQLNDARVVSRCCCGCASVDFSIGGVVPPPGNGIGILADFEYRTVEGYRCGIFVFECAGLLAGLEVWSADGLYIPSTLPIVEQLQPLVNVGRGPPSVEPSSG